MIDVLKFVSPDSLYSLALPKSWRSEMDSDCITFYSSVDGNGALQISAYQTDSPQSPVDCLNEYLADEKINARIFHRKGNGRATVAGSSFERKGLLTELWMITNGDVFLFVTYNRASNRDKTACLVIDRIIRSIELFECDSRLDLQ